MDGAFGSHTHAAHFRALNYSDKTVSRCAADSHCIHVHYMTLFKCVRFSAPLKSLLPGSNVRSVPSMASVNRGAAAAACLYEA